MLTRDNFLRRHSLLAAVAVSRINESLGTSLSTLDLYANPSVELLSARIKSNSSDTKYVVDFEEELKNYTPHKTFVYLCSRNNNSKTG